MDLQLSYAILCIVLIIIIWQDIKQRAIHFLLPIVVFLIALIINVKSDHLNYLMIFKNIGFVGINILGLLLYFSFKGKKVINPIDKKIGLGDVLFFIAITPLFNLRLYIVVFVLGMIFSLIMHLIVRLFNEQQSIPLAGYLAFFLIVFLFLERVLNLNLLYFIS